METSAWIIRSAIERDEKTRDPLYWSNADGWVDRESATVFSDYERERLQLPVAGEWEDFPGHACPTR